MINNSRESVIAVLIICAVWIAFTACGKGAGKSDGEPGVKFTVTDLKSGKVINGEDLRGKVVLVDFWATWCKPCIEEFPAFNELVKQYQSRGFEIIGISLDEGGEADVRPFMAKHQMDYYVALGNPEVNKLFAAEGSPLPLTILIDRKGKIRNRHVGFTRKEVFEKEILELLAES